MNAASSLKLRELERKRDTMRHRLQMRALSEVIQPGPIISYVTPAPVMGPVVNRGEGYFPDVLPRRRTNKPYGWMP